MQFVFFFFFCSLEKTLECRSLIIFPLKKVWDAVCVFFVRSKKSGMQFIDYFSLKQALGCSSWIISPLNILGCSSWIIFCSNKVLKLTLQIISPLNRNISGMQFMDYYSFHKGSEIQFVNYISLKQVLGCRSCFFFT